MRGRLRAQTDRSRATGSGREQQEEARADAAGPDRGADVTSPDPSLDMPPVPEYAGSADSGVVSSVDEHAGAAGDIVDALGAEHGKLRGVFDEVLELVRVGNADALRLRWGGVARELAEHAAAEGRVVLPAAQEAAGAGTGAGAGSDALEEVGRAQQELLSLLGEHDAFTADGVTPEQVGDVVERVAAHLRQVDAVVLPLLAQLPAAERMRLGEDLRQVKG
jgi:hypothetical protein